MGTFDDGIPAELCGLQPTTWDTYGGIQRGGQYIYVKYDRRNGPLVVGQLVSLRDEITFEVEIWKNVDVAPFGISIIALPKWTWWDDLRWRLKGRPPLGKWSPTRFFFVQTKG